MAHQYTRTRTERRVCTLCVAPATFIPSAKQDRTEFYVCDAKDADSENSLRFTAVTEARFDASTLSVYERKYPNEFLLAKRSPRFVSNSVVYIAHTTFAIELSAVGFAAATNNYNTIVEIFVTAALARALPPTIQRFYFGSNFISKQASCDEFFICGGNDLHLNCNEHRIHSSNRYRVWKFIVFFFKWFLHLLFICSLIVRWMWRCICATMT